jgi:peptidoglycan hydrolase-like protein with peptidoglycan-binding domain
MSHSNMKFLIAVLFLASLTTGRADPAVAKAQQVLKDEGFYYGQVTGEKNADTNAAIRRYQIRNGLQITGELDEQTLQSLRKAPVAAASPPAPLASPVARTTPVKSEADSSERQDDNARETNSANSIAPQPYEASPPQERETPMVYPGRAVPPEGGIFRGTPYETAPPEMQRKVIIDAQRILARRGLFKYQADGVFGSDLEFSLRAYQSRVGLRPTGRLDLETLAALELLPGTHERVYTPRRSLPPGAEPPVRGEWIRP